MSDEVLRGADDVVEGDFHVIEFQAGGEGSGLAVVKFNEEGGSHPGDYDINLNL